MFCCHQHPTVSDCILILFYDRRGYKGGYRNDAPLPPYHEKKNIIKMCQSMMKLYYFYSSD